MIYTTARYPPDGNTAESPRDAVRYEGIRVCRRDQRETPCWRRYATGSMSEPYPAAVRISK
ncbi:hypothetical protein GCM10010387_65340 [Streptomyces inusitatus]|uniref:Uncharacterized protein n=1 Tax=Streptomyces inusitatus TaxID=68221 RepID=A0A918V389_9ACTN|nr:hypothetical protein GCM10010387_65340 [Streptomyces inusitatus]